MKVKIINCSSKDSWYKNRMGEIFEVYKMHHDKKHYIIKDKPTYLIALKDCELVTKSSPCQNHDLETIKEESKATKHDSNKPSFSSIPQKALLEVAKGFSHGKEKYGLFNYSGEMEVLRYMDALQRHTNQYLTGEDIDESGVHHLALIACNALMALDSILTNKSIDNRNKVYKNAEK